MLTGEQKLRSFLAKIGIPLRSSKLPYVLFDHGIRLMDKLAVSWCLVFLLLSNERMLRVSLDRYTHMSDEMKTRLKENIKAHKDAFGLKDVLYGTFRRQHGP